MTKKLPVTAGDRIEIIDAFRGFALAGIVIVHMVEHYLGAAAPPDLSAAFAPGVGDKVIEGLMFLLFVGKFFAIFSFLFGLSFFIQMDRAARRGVDFRLRFAWRLVVLLIIGYAHSLFYRGDILTIYAVLGLFLVLFYNAGNKWILGVAALIIAGAGRYIMFALTGGETIFPYGDLSPDLAHNAAYIDALLNGSLLDVFAQNAWYGHMLKLEFQVGAFGRLYLTFAFFLLGMWAGRIGLFARAGEMRGPLKKAIWISLAVIAVLIVLSILMFSGGSGGNEQMQFTTWAAMFALTTMDIFNLALATILLAGFVLLFLRPAGQRVLGKLAPYGRMALSNYVLQSLIGTFVLYNWGLGLIGDLTNAEMLLVAVAVLALQVSMSAWWLRRFRYGPLEWLWRSATHLQWQPMKLR